MTISFALNHDKSLQSDFYVKRQAKIDFLKDVKSIVVALYRVHGENKASHFKSIVCQALVTLKIMKQNMF